MALNTSRNDHMEMRRERVAQLRARCLTVREIADVLAKGDANGNGKLLNPENGLPYSHVTIASDLKALKAQWHESANVAMDEHIARQAQELLEIKRAGWAGKDPELVRKTLRDEMDLLGTKKPQEINININIVYQIIELAEHQGIDASALFEGMLRRLQSANR